MSKRFVFHSVLKHLKTPFGATFTPVVGSGSRRRNGYEHSKRKLWFERLEDRRMLTVETEPNDTLATADVFSLPDALDGAITTTGDVDFWKTTLTQGQTLIVRPGATQVFLVACDS